MGFPGRHGPAQLVGFAGGEAGRHHGQFDHLFLEDGHTEGALQHLAHGIVRVIHRLQAVLSAQVRVHHVTLDGARPNDGHLNHQIVIGFRFQAGQHVDLGPGFHLEYADAVACLKHGVGVTVFLGNVLYPERLAFFIADQFQRFSNGGEHAKGQHIHLHQPQALKVVLVPLDYGAVGHGSVLHWHQFGQWPGADHETAHVLGQMSGEAQQGIH